MVTFYKPQIVVNLKSALGNLAENTFYPVDRTLSNALRNEVYGATGLWNTFAFSDLEREFPDRLMRDTFKRLMVQIATINASADPSQDADAYMWLNVPTGVTNREEFLQGLYVTTYRTRRPTGVKRTDFHTGLELLRRDDAAALARRERPHLNLSFEAIRSILYVTSTLKPDALELTPAQRRFLPEIPGFSRTEFAYGERIRRDCWRFSAGRFESPRAADLTGYGYILSMNGLPSVERIMEQIDSARTAYRNRVLAGIRGASDAQARADQVAKERKRAESLRNYESHRGERDRALASKEMLIPTMPMVIAGKGTKASRRWGIEVETGAGRNVERVPDQWDSKDDGSLESAYSGYRTEYIEPEDCDYAPYHSLDPSDRYYRNPDSCNEHGEVERYYDEWDDEDCIELVSPILNSMHSRGLRDICGYLEDAPRTESAGVHVHVEAKDLTMAQIRELVLGYDHIEPLIESSYDRVERGYCKRRAPRELLEVARYAKDNPKANPRDSWSFYGQRYVTVNLQALEAHGTVEFRAMGPLYNYDHLIRWSMFCREMVNAAANGATAKDFNKVASWGDLMNLFRRFGSELNLAEMTTLDVVSEAEQALELALV